MPNKCGVVNCKGNYDPSQKCRVFRLPKDTHEQQKWLNVLPLRDGFVIDLSKFFICEKHCPADTQTVAIPGGSTRPVSPTSILMCLRLVYHRQSQHLAMSTVEDLLNYLKYFLYDKILSFATFRPDNELQKTYKKLLLLVQWTNLCVFSCKVISAKAT